MKGFIDSFRPIFSKFKFEIIFLILAFLISLASLLFFIISSKNDSYIKPSLKNSTDQELKSTQKIMVEISGAVVKPDVYEMTSGARIRDILIQSGGLSDDADRAYFSHNFNLARILNDQDKIYIPTLTEVNNGIFLENKRTLDYLGAQKIIYSQQNTVKKAKQININTSSLSELDALTNIGKSTAQKIIQNRPYLRLEDLIDKKIINDKVFAAIKDSIQL